MAIDLLVLPLINHLGLGFFVHPDVGSHLPSTACNEWEGGVSVDVPKGWAVQWVEVADVCPLRGHFPNQHAGGRGAAPYPTHPSVC